MRSPRLKQIVCLLGAVVLAGLLVCGGIYGYRMAREQFGWQSDFLASIQTAKKVELSIRFEKPNTASTEYTSTDPAVIQAVALIFEKEDFQERKRFTRAVYPSVSFYASADDSQRIRSVLIKEDRTGKIQRIKSLLTKVVPPPEPVDFSQKVTLSMSVPGQTARVEVSSSAPEVIKEVLALTKQDWAFQYRRFQLATDPYRLSFHATTDAAAPAIIQYALKEGPAAERLKQLLKQAPAPSQGAVIVERRAP